MEGKEYIFCFHSGVIHTISLHILLAPSELYNLLLSILPYMGTEQSKWILARASDWNLTAPCSARLLPFSC